MTQTKLKLYVNNEVISPLKENESFKYLGRYFNFSMNNQKHKEELLETATTTLNNISKPPFHPNNKLSLYSKYLLSKLLWHLTIADIPDIWVKQNLDSLCHKKLRSWLEISINGTLDTVRLPKSSLGLNIIDISTKYIECQVSIWRKPSNIRYDNYKSCEDVLTDIKNKKIDNITNNLTSQSLVIKSLWKESTTYSTKIWQIIVDVNKLCY